MDKVNAPTPGENSGSDISSINLDNVHFSFDGIETIGEKAEVAPAKAEVKVETPPAKSEKTEVAPVKQEQSPEQNRAFKEMRVAKEAAEAKIAKLSERITKLFGKDFDIKDIDSYVDMVEKQVIDEKREDLISQGKDPNKDAEYLALVAQNEELTKEVEEVTQEIQEVRQEQANNEVLNDFNALKEKYPEFVKTVNDLDDKTKAYFDKGLTLKEAFELANMPKIIEAQKAAAKQEAINSIGSKQHLKTEGDGADAADDVAIDPSTMEMYLSMGMEKAEAVAFHKMIYR